MKRWTLLSAIAVAGALAADVAAQRPPDYKVERIADNLAVISDGNDGNTAVFIR